MSAAARPEDAAGSSGLEYVPALDGLRAICVLGVLCFHAGFDWARGGFLGVSTFFTLSGYLVTTILVGSLEAQRARGVLWPRVRLADFWRRRLRRLMPASIVTLLLVVIVAPGLVGPEAQARLGADVVASLLYVVNWRFVQGDYAYSLIFSSPSLLQHYWSLAIEGQLYVVLPLIAVAAARRPDPARAFGAISAAMLVIGVACAFVLGADPEMLDRIYYGTDTRAPELLAGALLALALRTHPKETGRSPGREADGLSWLLLAILLLCFARVPLSSELLHRGGFVVFAGLSSALVAACVRGRAVGRLLEWGPLVWIGRVSYGAYLFHWPIFLALDAWLPEPTPLWRITVGGAATLLLAGASHALVETPIRRGRGVAGRAPLLAGAAALVVVTTCVAIRLPASAVLDELRGAAAERAVPAVPAETTGSGAPRIAVFGDSVGFTFSKALIPWLRQRPDAMGTPGSGAPGCGLLLPDELRRRRAAGQDVSEWQRQRDDGMRIRWACLEVPVRIAMRLEGRDPDLAVVLGSVWDLFGLPAETEGAPRRIGHPETDARLREVMDAHVELLTSRGAEVAWLTLPVFRVKDDYPMSPREADATRARYNQLVHELAARHPGRVHVVDLAAWIDGWPGGAFDPALREDGLHLTLEGGLGLLDTGLGDELVALARAARARREADSERAAPSARSGAAVREGDARVEQDEAAASAP